MREAAERRQQLELEHEQALAVLNAKQQEIELLQKVSKGNESKIQRQIAVIKQTSQQSLGLKKLNPQLHN